ncbi:MAG: VOC family protein [Anaerolineae bacterium]
MSCRDSSAVLEFEVEDGDEEYVRLLALNVPIVKPPTTQPWGLRSVWFRDPDGNIVNFFAAVNPSAD